MDQSVRRSSFSFTRDFLAQIAQDVLSHARHIGASSCEVEVSEGFGQTVSVRQAEVENIEYNKDKGVGVTVYLGQQRGHASTSDFTPKAVRETVEKALSIARFTASDDCAGLAEKEFLATEFPDLDLFHPWVLPVDQAIEIAKTCEAAGLAVDPRVKNSEGANVSTQQSHFIYANSNGFMEGYPSSRHSISCSVIAAQKDEMQRDDWYSMARSADNLDRAADVGRRAGERSVRRLGAKRMQTIEAPVLFEAPIASSLLGHFVGAASGGSLYRKSSFLLDSLGKQIFSPIVQIHDRPDVARGLGSSPFDDEGVRTQRRAVVKNGVLEGYFLGSYSARKLGMRTTGNAGGSHNLILDSTGEDFPALLKKMGRGLLVTELLGMGVNQLTGDYSRGAAGFWVEGGDIAYPVEEITIASTLQEMFKGIVAIGSDVLVRGARQSGSVLIDRMTIGGE
jgi:PmbA protein